MERAKAFLYISLGMIGGCFAATQVHKSYITQADYGTLVEAMQHGCEPEEDRIRQTIQDFCTTHPLTKGNHHYDGRKESGAKRAGK